MAETPQIDIETTNDGFSLTEKTYSGIPTDERYPLYQVDHALRTYP